MTDEQIQYYRDQVAKLQAEADRLPEDSTGALVEKIRLLTSAHMYMGRLSAEMHGTYKRIYATRKRVFVMAKKNAKRGDKTFAAEEAVLDLRDLEAGAYEDMIYWKNELDYTREKIYELRMRVRIDMHIGGGING